ncbi:MAG TPA: O-methyltransferase [Acidimicrobiia bacterium]|nr:O-methyltransferase [Acidimicrobiia bacterium]
MPEMTPERWQWLNRYARSVFGDPDEQLATLVDRATDAGLPSIAVSPDVGRLLQILAASTPGRLALELGTLGGYSGIWIARGLAPDGKLITVELEPKHADFAEAEFASAGLADRVEVRRGAALEVLEALTEELEEGTVDFVFLDAVKTEYPDYFRAIKPLMAPGAILVADNVYGTGQGWIDEGYGTDEFNRLIAADPDFLATAVAMREGVLIARRM